MQNKDNIDHIQFICNNLRKFDDRPLYYVYIDLATSVLCILMCVFEFYCTVFS